MSITPSGDPGPGSALGPTRAELARRIDHTLLEPLAARRDVEALCVEALGLGVATVCIAPTRVEQAAAALAGTAIGVCAVVGFPTGAHQTSVKVAEALACLRAGAVELDMVADLGAVADGDLAAVGSDIAAVCAVAGDHGALVKVIVEAAALSVAQVIACCRAAEDAGAAFVKTSTGMHRAGGATVEAVATMRAAVGPGVRVKAAGGIRTTAAALSMVDAGADRIGTSSAAVILAGLAVADA